MGLTLKTYKMKKIILTIAFIASGLVASAQVGIGNTDPKVSLQVDKSADAAKADGVLVPRVTVAELNTKAAAYGADQNGSLVFITAITSAANETSNVTATGFHYYNSTTDKWVALVAAAATPVRSARVPTNGTLTNADINGYIIDGNGFSYNLASLTGMVDGDTITFMQNSSLGLTINGVAAGSSTSPFQQGGGITYVYDVETASWYSINSY